MEPEGSLPHSHVSATCPYPEPARSSPCPTSHFLKILLNILPSTPGSTKWFFPPGFSTETLYTPLLSQMRATCTAHLILLDFITRTVLGEEYRSLSTSLLSFLHSLVTSSLLGPNILLSLLFSDTLSLRSSLDVSDQVSHPYKTTGKIILLYIVIFNLLDSQPEDTRFCTVTNTTKILFISSKVLQVSYVSV